MTTDDDVRASEAHESNGPSIHVVRARKLLLGGAIGGVAAAIICLIVFTIIGGLPGLQSAALAAAMVLFFYAVGQYVMVLFADAGARTLMVASLVSYTARMGIIGMGLVAYSKNLESWPGLNRTAIFATTIAVVVGWLTVEIFVFSRLRIGAYDTEYVSPATAGEMR